MKQRPSHCEHCGASLRPAQPGRAGRPARFCSQRCRRAEARSRKRAARDLLDRHDPNVVAFLTECGL